MKRDTPAIDKAQLVGLINAAYGLDVLSLTFLPRGEVSYSYVANTSSSARYFMKATPPDRAEGLEVRLRIARELHTTAGLREVVQPYETLDGALACHYEGFTVAVYDYVDAVPILEEPLTEDELARAAASMAAIHDSVTSLALPAVPRETFTLPFRATLLQVLEASRDPGLATNGYRRRVQQALEPEHDDVIAVIAMMDRLRDAIGQLDLTWFVTHGDPTPGNILKDRAGQLYLIDWDDVALGPPERDLVYFTDDQNSGSRFATFVRHYLAAADPRMPRAFHREIFAFYIYRWILQEIADFGARILFGAGHPVDDEHSWAELSQYLPIDHGEIERGLDAIQETIQAEGGTNR